MKYISDLCANVAETFDARKNLLDLVLFDGAGNVQSAGECLQCFYPRLTVLHSVEHVCGLFL